MQINLNKLKHACVMLLLFFMAMNFKAKFFYFVFFTLFMVMIMRFRNFHFPDVAFVYAGLSIIMALYNYSEGLLSMVRCVSPLAMYLVGYNYVDTKKRENLDCDSWLKETENAGNKMLLMIALGSFAHYMANFFLNSGSVIGRNTIDIWSGQRMAATGQGALACVMLGLAVSMLFLPLLPRYRIYGLACIMGILFYNMILAGRTLIIVLIILLIFASWYSDHALKKQRNRRIKLWVTILLGIVVLGLVLAFDIGGNVLFSGSSNFYQRFRGLQDILETSGRMRVKLYYLKDALRYPFGGCHMQNRYSYAHDLLLDAYDEYGIVVFALLIAILILTTKRMYVFVKRTKFSEEIKLAYLCVLISIMLYFCVEPILVGMPWLFSCYCLFGGYLASATKFHSNYEWM